MKEIRIRQLANPTSSELDVAANVLAKAFEFDDFANSAIGGNQALMIPFHRATLAAAALGGELYVASYGAHDIVGVAAWFGPGTALLHTPEQGEVGFNALMASFSPELRKWWLEYFLPIYEEQTTSALGEGTKFASWHLQVIGVLPELQGNGIAGSLVKAVESKAHSAGQATCLEAENEENVPIYEHWGYTVKGKGYFKSPLGGFPMYVMIKGPETVS